MGWKKNKKIKKQIKNTWYLVVVWQVGVNTTAYKYDRMLRRTKQVSHTASPWWYDHVNTSIIVSNDPTYWPIFGLENTNLRIYIRRKAVYMFKSIPVVRNNASASTTNNVHISQTTSSPRQKSPQWCVPLVHAGMRISSVLNKTMYSGLYCPKVEFDVCLRNLLVFHYIFIMLAVRQCCIGW